MKSQLFTILMLAATSQQAVTAGEKELIKYGDFSQWVVRDIQESKLLGGNRKTVYEIGPEKKIEGNVPYYNSGGSPWATSNVYAKVSGIVKASNTVSPAIRNGNKVAKLEAKMEHVKVLGIVNMDVMVTGTIFLGEVFEPITGTAGAFSKMEMGIPFDKRPKALVYDFQVTVPEGNKRTKATGFSSKKTLQGSDNAEVYILLQKRWEDANGKLYAQRVGTGRERYPHTVGWTEGHRLPVHYGDISREPFYKPWMGLLNGEKAYYARNSKGKLVPVEEVGWAPDDAVPTHVLVMASTTCGEPFIGTEGLTMLIDNIAFEY